MIGSLDIHSLSPIECNRGAHHQRAVVLQSSTSIPVGRGTIPVSLALLLLRMQYLTVIY